MTPKKNTPTPWTQINGSSMVIEAQDGTWIAKTFEDNPNNYADTAFIVQCVNEREALKASHKELLEAVTVALEYIFEAKSKDDPKIGLACHALNLALTNAQKVDE